ncbi:MAG TPA: hypothetical protein PLU30_06105, partial [Verrucomicrobiae bacterium]|nr:hypothetical protein [Verrucomicrobiae bacterium]
IPQKGQHEDGQYGKAETVMSPERVCRPGQTSWASRCSRRRHWQDSVEVDCPAQRRQSRSHALNSGAAFLFHRW